MPPSCSITSWNTSQGPQKSITVASSEIRNAARMVPRPGLEIWPMQRPLPVACCPCEARARPMPPRAAIPNIRLNRSLRRMTPPCACSTPSEPAAVDVVDDPPAERASRGELGAVAQRDLVVAVELARHLADVARIDDHRAVDSQEHGRV